MNLFTPIYKTYTVLKTIQKYGLYQNDIIILTGLRPHFIFYDVLKYKLWS